MNTQQPVTQKPAVQKVVTQLKRELWEHKTGFIWVPLAVTLLWTLLACYALINHQSLRSSIHWNFEMNQYQDSNHPSADSNPMDAGNPEDASHNMGPELENLIHGDSSHPDFLTQGVGVAINLHSIILFNVFFIVLLHFAHSTLFEDRKSREILFWRSMPVSETQNVLTKLAMIMLVAPGIMLLMSIASGVFTLLLGAIAFSSWATFSSVADLLLIPLEVFTSSFFRLLILLPVIGWIFCASAFAKKSPFLISTLIPLGALLVDRLLSNTLGIDMQIKRLFISYFETLQHFQPGPLPDFILQQGMLAIAVGCLLIAATIWLRNNRYEL